MDADHGPARARGRATRCRPRYLAAPRARPLQPLPLGISPHKLRHTFASILVAIGKDPTYVMQQLGHTDPAFTLRVYSHMMRRSKDEREALKALVEGRVLPGNSQGSADPTPHGARDDRL
jgi:integrase